MRYKKGDRVRVRGLEWYNANKNSKGVIILQDWRIFEESMSEFCGKVVTIDSYSSRGNYYDIKEDGKVNYWSDDMFEGLAIEKPQAEIVNKQEFVERTISYFTPILKTYCSEECVKELIGGFINSMEE
jgi:hypothetical protein